MTIKEVLDNYDREFPQEESQRTTHRGELDPEKILENGHKQIRNRLRYDIKSFLKVSLSHQKSELREKIKNTNLLTKDIPNDIVLDYEKSAIYLSGYERAKSDLLDKP